MPILDHHLLERFWFAMAVHLWQTTLVLLLLWALAQAMRTAPARLLNGFWWLGLIKLFLPLALLGRLARHVLPVVLDGVSVSSSATHRLAGAMGNVETVLDPVTPSAHVARLAATPGLLEIVTLLWMAGAAWLLGSGLRRRRAEGLAALVGANDSVGRLPQRLTAALAGTSVPPSAVVIVPGPGLLATVGLLRPRIVISRALVGRLSVIELRAVLLHENEHRLRFDPLLGAIQWAAQALFICYPPLGLILRRLRATAEMACDEAVLSAGIDPTLYAAALARTIKLGLSPTGSPAAADPREVSLICRRFRRLKEPRRFVAMTRHRVVFALAALIVVVGSLLPWAPTASSEQAGGSDRPPELISTCAPEFPKEAQERGCEGKIVLKLVIAEDGSIAEIDVAQEVAECPEFTRSAEVAARQFRFRPSLKDGKPVRSSVLIPFLFSLDEKAQSAKDCPAED